MIDNRIKPDWVLVNGRQEKHPEGIYISSGLTGESAAHGSRIRCGRGIQQP